MHRYEIKEVKPVFRGFFGVDEAHLTFERGDGTMSPVVSRLSVERGDAVGLIVLNSDTNRLIFVRQFRYPTIRHGEPWVLECVAGAIDKGEFPEEAARRELEEELGFRARELVPLGQFYSSPGGMSEMLSMYFTTVVDADRAGAGGGLTDEHEDLEAIELTKEEVTRMLLKGELRDSKTVSGLFLAHLLNLL